MTTQEKYFYNEMLYGVVQLIRFGKVGPRINIAIICNANRLFTGRIKNINHKLIKYKARHEQ